MNETKRRGKEQMIAEQQALAAEGSPVVVDRASLDRGAAVVTEGAREVLFRGDAVKAFDGDGMVFPGARRRSPQPEADRALCAQLGITRVEPAGEVESPPSTTRPTLASVLAVKQNAKVYAVVAEEHLRTLSVLRHAVRRLFFAHDEQRFAGYGPADVLVGFKDHSLLDPNGLGIIVPAEDAVHFFFSL